MFDRVRALELIERAIDDHPTCPLCQSPSEVVDEGDGVIVIRCRASAAPEGRLARLSAAVLPHLHRSVVDLSEGVAA